MKLLTKYILLFTCVLTVRSVVYSQTPVTPQAQYASGTPVNYIRVWEPVKPLNTVAEVIDSNRTTKEVRQTTQYMDGLGRNLQTVVKKGSLATGGTQYDLVMPVVYDAFGREQFKYLPYASASENNGRFKNNPFNEQVSFYNNQLTGQTGETNIGTNNLNWAYSKTNFEASPLNRVEESFAPGSSWVGSEAASSAGDRHPVKMSYWINTGADTVRIWNVTNVSNSFGTYHTSSTYPAGELYKNVAEDERGKQVIEFKDKEGKVILKKVQLTAAKETNGTGSGHAGWICTYYIYDDLNNLRAVIQPEGVKLLDGAGWANCNPVSNTTLLAEQTFRYEYDQRQRMIMKKVPGAGEVYMVYDPWDRLLLSQDANMRLLNQYLLTKYDALNRPVMTGIYTNGATIQQLRTDANAANTNRFEARASSAQGYTSDCWPTSNYDVLTVTYYDDYNWHGNPFSQNRYTGDDGLFLNPNPNDFPYPEAITQSFQTKGMVTGSRRRILGTSDFLQDIIYYDAKGRVLQTYALNQTGGPLVQTNQYSFSGQVLRSYQLLGHNGANQAIGILNIYAYDDLGRLADIKKTTYTSFGISTPEVMIVKNEYDKLGQLKNKRVGKKRNTSNPTVYIDDPVETVTYDYNIRGWMLGMNRSFLETPSNTSNWFGFELGYDKTSSKGYYGYYNVGQFNGNITGTLWKSKGDLVARKYDFSYDAANRLLSADFNQQSGTNWTKAEVDFSVGGDPATGGTMKYDDNGNIKEMWQKGLLLTSSDWIDKLSYNYSTGTNKLLNVIDGSNNAQTKLGDFRTSTLHPVQSKTTSTVDYTYDANGNLKKDLNKDIGISSNEDIVYNHLNLPQIITVRTSSGAVKGTITYTYDATGSKLRKTTEENNVSVTDNNQTANNTVTTTTDYVGVFVYESKTYSIATGLNYSNKLQFGGHEEGRIRALYTNTSTPHTPTGFAFDYMLKDHLGNVRMVLTDELNTNYYAATTLEGTYDGSTNSMVNEERKYYNINSAYIFNEPWGSTQENNEGDKQYKNHNDIPPALPNPNYPSGVSPTQTASSTKMYKLNGSTNKTGLEFVMKVMAGDKVDILGKSYHTNATQVSNSNSSPMDLLGMFTSLLLAPINAVGSKGVTASNLQNLNNGLVPNSFFRGNNNETGTTVPKAYINYIFLDEQFKYIDGSGGFSRVGSAGTVKNHWNIDAALQNINAPKNGYLFVYVSNESNFDVFFDNLQVVHKPGPILEETHYYPFGLSMAGISSTSIPNSAPNKKKYNGIEETRELDLNQYDAFYRTLDPQLGRFWQIDPKIESADSWSPYSAMLDNPIRYSDPLGDSSIVPYPARIPTFNPFSPLIYQGYANIKAENVRTQYNKDVAKLSPNDKQGRADLKEKARTNTPEPFKTIVEQGRPMSGEQAKVKDPNFKGNATKTNIEVNETVKTTGTLGKVFIGTAIFQSGVTIAKSDNPVRETATEGAGWASSIYVGGQFSAAMAPLGPVPSFVGGVVGGTVGYIGGKAAGDAVADEATKPRLWKFPSMPVFSIFKLF